jgi:ketosteroid isomerase-like protein
MARAKKPASDVQLIGDKSAARSIVAERERFNQALVERDIETIRFILAERATLVPGDEADLINGRDAQIQAWQTIFTSMPDVNYVRIPQRVEIGDDGSLAAESGRWRGGWSTDGMAISYSGRYFAKWRSEGTEWQIEAETFVTLKRSGGMV